MESHVAAQRRRITDWLPAALWAGLIFLFSGDSFAADDTGRFLGPLLRFFILGVSDGTIQYIHLAVRKLGHFGEYFILAVLLARALRTEPPFRRAAVGLALTGLYAVSDEVHQWFVPSRTGSVADVALDFFGGSCGTLWAYLRRRRASQERKSWRRGALQ